MGGNSSTMAEEMAQRQMMAEEMAQRQMRAEIEAQRQRRAEREAQHHMKRMAEIEAQRQRMAEIEAQREKERRAERRSQLCMKRLDDFIGPDMDPVGDHDDLMAIREAELRMERRAEEMAQREKERRAVRRARLRMIRGAPFCPCDDFPIPLHLMLDCSSSEEEDVADDKDLVKSPDDLMAERRARLRKERLMDFGSDVSAVEDFNKLLDDLMAVRRARLRMIRRALFCPCGLSHTPPHLRQGDFSSSEKKLVVSAVEKWIKSLDDQMAVRRAQLCMKRWVDFGSDVSAVKDFNKLLDDLMAVRRAWLRMERRAQFCPCDDFHPLHLRRALFCLCDDFHPLHLRGAPFCPCHLFHTPPHLSWWEIPSTVKKLVVSAVDDWINSLDDQFTGMATRRKKSIPIRCHSLPRMAVRRLDSIESRDFGVPFGINRYSSLPRLEDFGSDVSADEVLKKILDDLRAMRRPESPDSGVSYKSDQSKEDVTNFKDRDSPRMSVRSLESNDSDVSLKSDRSKDGWIDFKDKVSPRSDFSSSVKKHIETHDEDLVKSPDDLRAEREARLRKKRRAERRAQRDKESSEQQQRPHSAGTSVNMGGNSSTMSTGSVIPTYSSPPRMSTGSVIPTYRSPPRRAEREARLRKKRRAAAAAQRDKESSEQQQRPHSAGTSVNMGEDWSKMAEEMARLHMEIPPLCHTPPYTRLVNFGSDVSAVKDLNRPLDNQRK